MTHRHMHRCRGAHNPERCKYRFPAPVTPVSFWDNDHRKVVHQRRCLGDDSNVIEHNLFLLRKMECRVNVRAVVIYRCIAYLAKYLYKPDAGDDKALVKVTGWQGVGPEWGSQDVDDVALIVILIPEVGELTWHVGVLLRPRLGRAGRGSRA